MERVIPADAETRLTLAFLWVWVLFNYVYGDIFHIFIIFTRPDMQAQLEAGHLGGMPLNQTSMLVMAALMELSLMMAFLSWKLRHRLNRLFNIAVGSLFTMIMAATLLASGRLPPLSGYTLYGLIEMAITTSIVITAWQWRTPPQASVEGSV